MRQFNVIIVLLGALALTACGGGSPTPSINKSANILDSAVEGLGYSIDGGVEQYTDKTGKFDYSSSDSKVTFKIGGLTLKKDFLLSKINVDNKVFPTDLVGVDRNNVTNPQMIKILQILQTLDEDSNPDNGVKITVDTREDITTIVDIADADVSASAVVHEANKTLISESKAIAHFIKTLKNENINIAPVIATTAPTTATEDILYSYNANVNDADSGDTHTWSILGKPANMTLNSNTGQINWTPLEGVTTSGEITLTVTDNGTGNLTAIQRFTIAVTQVNDAPVIATTAPTTATEDTLYSYNANVNYDSGDTHIWSISGKPANMTLNSNTGQINWTPLEGVTTSGEITLSVTDSGNLTAVQRFTIAVTQVNDAPVITTIAPTTATEDTIYSYDANMRDVDNGDTHTWSIPRKPTGMTLNTSTGQINWTPLEGVTTSGEITLSVTDSGNLTAIQRFTIAVTQVNDAPVINSAGSINVVENNIDAGYTASATDAEGNAITYNLSGVDKDLFELDGSSGALTFKSAPDFENAVDVNTNNVYELDIKASDGTATTTKPLSVQVIKQQPLVVVRIEFNDMTFDHGASIWAKKIFGSSEGQLNHYFNEISQGRYQFVKAVETQGTTNDGVITATLAINHPNSGRDFAQKGIVDALIFADSSIDFSQYDTNKDGEISQDELQLLFLVAGGESAIGQSPGVWAHAASVTNPITHDGVKLRYYSMFGEKHSDNKDATIGIIAHELGHVAFNLPDLYDTSENTEGIGQFGLMGAGSWGKKESEQPGKTPTHMTAWSKANSRFTYPIALATGTHSDLSVESTASDKYRAYKVETGSDKEYFLIENRAGRGYDLGLHVLNGNSDGSLFPGGLLILHINDNKESNSDKNYRWVDVEEANNAELDKNPNHNNGGGGHINNLFFSNNSVTFGNESTPNSKRYDGNPSGVSVTDISAAGDTMTITVIKN
ncbi:Fibronectin type III domain protein [Bathymodiolus heckerae thiotrophic gill symbiont]|uniref:M6 family metalloprotease domain-containing protein n=1 Tax=Bathymodiolus heckerae thiotrophic gill symbiont TaxID=1052212 RepID=UPI0010BB0C8F|nr:M6 family metalloprotease domain-containing protein [Bathymodiolus heckerae thiotrophic gill symbiont]SMN12625.1 Fibronectin type III domain protein [Bathymodiolus heckerae thiotrophic gill symbiont]